MRSPVRGDAYIKTNSINGEANLKLQKSPSMPLARNGRMFRMTSNSLFNGGQDDNDDSSQAKA